MEESLIDQKITAIREVLCHVAGFPHRKKADMSPVDFKAVELLTSELWEPKASNSRLETYIQLYSLYGEETVPEHVHRLAHIMTCRYSPVPGSEVIRQAEEASRPVETFGSKGGFAVLKTLGFLCMASFAAGWAVVAVPVLYGLGKELALAVWRLLS